jgi:hypothetical protein
MKRNWRFSLAGSSEKGLMVKSRDCWPTFRYDPPKMVVRDSKLPPMSKMNVSGSYFWAFCNRKFEK